MLVKAKDLPGLVEGELDLFVFTKSTDDAECDKHGVGIDMQVSWAAECEKERSFREDAARRSTEDQSM